MTPAQTKAIEELLKCFDDKNPLSAMDSWTKILPLSEKAAPAIRSLLSSHQELKEKVERDSKLLDSGMILFNHPADEWGSTSTIHKYIDLRSCIESAMASEAKESH